MKNLTFLAVLVGALALVGCQSESGATPESTATTESTTTTAETKPAEGATVAMVACAGCNKELAENELKMDHGKLTCAACIAAHGH